MERTKVITGSINFLIYVNDNNTFENTRFESNISTPYKYNISALRNYDSSEANKIDSIKAYSITFNDCTFDENINIISDNNEECVLTFSNCIFEKDIIAEDAVMDGKVRFRNCHFKGNVNFRNTTFNNLADFWSCTFYKSTTFYKTDFNATAVFSSSTFNDNVLFTYALFDGKTIFGRTRFNKGLDISQAIIGGELQIFDLSFDYHKYVAEYVGTDNDKFQDYIDNQNNIPLINKVATFQILKSQYAKQGNHIDEITMRKEEKNAFSALTEARKKDDNWTRTTGGDRFILWLNRKSNHYKSDFRNGISFTVIVAILFLFLTLVTTGAFWRCLSTDCEFDSDVIGFTIKSFINFLNPVHRITYLSELNPILGIPYIFDFFGRIAVGYGIYQTVQAFRKFR